jgi:multicomponent Na+:H+ antiporter subunit G
VVLLLGVFFIFVASLGIWRLRDVYGRAHAAGKSSTMGAICTMLAGLVYFTGYGWDVAVKHLLIIIFLFLTSPVGTHLLIWAAYATGTRLWPGSIIDELKGRL